MTTVAMMVSAAFLSMFALKLFGAASAAIAMGAASFAAISVNETVIPVLLAVLSSGFIFGLFKIMPERRSILVQASENAVKVVNDAIGTLQKELIEARLEIARLEGELTTAKRERDRVMNELQTLRTKVTRLEEQLDIYKNIRGIEYDRPIRGTERRRVDDG